MRRNVVSSRCSRSYDAGAAAGTWATAELGHGRDAAEAATAAITTSLAAAIPTSIGTQLVELARMAALATPAPVAAASVAFAAAAAVAAAASALPAAASLATITTPASSPTSSPATATLPFCRHYGQRR